jgi:hypothetical protein
MLTNEQLEPGLLGTKLLDIFDCVVIFDHGGEVLNHLFMTDAIISHSRHGGIIEKSSGMATTVGKRSKVEWTTLLDVRGQLTKLFGEIFSVEGRDGELRVGVMDVMGQICTSKIGSQSMTMSLRDAKYGVAG